jgi:hypothetical protein
MREFIKEYRRHQTGLMITAVSLLAVVVLFSLPSTSVANNQADRPPARNFLRFIEEQSEQGTPRAALETSIVTLTHRDGRSIDLVSMVHVADAPYYAQINELAKTYDAALYELVKSEGAGVPKPGEKSKSGVSFLQRMMENVLKLEYQLDAIDYTAPNFVRAVHQASGRKRRITLRPDAPANDARNGQRRRRVSRHGSRHDGRTAGGF